MSNTPAEKKWIADLRRLAKRKPNSLRLYVTDSHLQICKAGVPTTEFNDSVKLQIYPGCFLTELHDDQRDTLQQQLTEARKITTTPQSIAKRAIAERDEAMEKLAEAEKERNIIAKDRFSKSGEIELLTQERDDLAAAVPVKDAALNNLANRFDKEIRSLTDSNFWGGVFIEYREARAALSPVTTATEQ